MRLRSLLRNWKCRHLSQEQQRAALSPYDILVFPIVDWEYLFQRPQHLSLHFGRRGHRVFYFATELVPDLYLPDLQPKYVADNVFVFSLPGSDNPPNIYLDLPNDGQLAAMEVGISQLRDKFKFQTTLSIVDYPFWTPLVKRLQNNVILYDCMDDYASFEISGPPAAELEPVILKEADLVVCSSLHLQQKARQQGRESVLIRNAADISHFERLPAKLAIESGRQTVGYHGQIGEWTDIDLLADAARAMPDKRFVFVGPVRGADVTELELLPNVTMVGEVSYEQLPAYVHSFDVCLLPYRICDYALASDPVKLWEYLAAGKPVVAARYPEIERLAGVITLTENRDDFIAGIRRALGEDALTAEKRREFARQNTWAHRCDEMLGAVSRLFPKISLIILCHNQLRFTRVTLDSVERFTAYPNIELVLVDNGSTDGTSEFLTEWASHREFVKVVLNHENLGFSAGNNRGARAASSDYLVIMNNDVFVTRGWLGDLLPHFRTDPKLGMLCPVTNASGNLSVIDINYQDMEEMAVKARQYVRNHRGQRTSLDVMHLFCAMIPRPVWDEVGELDEGYGIGLFEDNDYTMRVRAAGYTVACAEDVFVHHHHSASFGALPPGEYERLFAKNRKYYESKWGPWKAPVSRKELRAKSGC